MSDTMRPEDYIITRKRKKYRFALFASSPLCFEMDEWTRRPVDEVEVGAGTGLFSVELAMRNPEKVFVALDVKGDRLQKGAHVATDRGLDNILFVRARADQMTELFELGSLSSIWLTFPDPFPRKGSAGRRLTHPHFLALYRDLLLPDGTLFLKHDNDNFFHWSLEQLVEQRWVIEELSFDLHESSLDEVSKIHTTYETRWVDEGATIKFVKATHSVS